MKLTDEESELFCAPPDKSAHKNSYTTMAKYMCYDAQDGSGIIQVCQMIDTQTRITQTDDRRYVTVLKEMIDEALKENDNSDDDKDTKKESDDGTDAN